MRVWKEFYMQDTHTENVMGAHEYIQKLSTSLQDVGELHYWPMFELCAMQVQHKRPWRQHNTRRYKAEVTGSWWVSEAQVRTCIYVLRWGEHWLKQDLDNWLNRRAGTARGKWASGCIPASERFRQRDLLQETSRGKIQKQPLKHIYLPSAKGFTSSHFPQFFVVAESFPQARKTKSISCQTHT